MVFVPRVEIRVIKRINRGEIIEGYERNKEVCGI